MHLTKLKVLFLLYFVDTPANASLLKQRAAMFKKGKGIILPFLLFNTVETSTSSTSAAAATTDSFIGVMQQRAASTLSSSYSSTPSLSPSSSKTVTNINAIPQPINLSPELHCIVADQITNLYNGKVYVRYNDRSSIDQIAMFGNRGAKMLNIVECDETGYDTQYAYCKSNNVNTFPTWEIAKKKYPGPQDIYDLEAILCKEKGNKLKCLRNGEEWLEETEEERALTK